MTTTRIEGGYVLLSKSILNNRIFELSPGVFKVACYLLMTANYESEDLNGEILIRGESWKTNDIIQRDCKMSPKAVRYALDSLKDLGFITTRNAPARMQRRAKKRAENGAKKGTKNGSIVTVCNYNRYQNMKNYLGAEKTAEKTAYKGALL